jgi:hypothetical protein
VSLGISPPQRELWGRLHEAHGEGPAVTVSTDGVAGRPSPELGFLYRVSGWDHAVTLTNLIAGGDAARARRAAAALGRLSGALSIPGLSSIEILLGAETDVLVWLMLPTG